MCTFWQVADHNCTGLYPAIGSYFDARQDNGAGTNHGSIANNCVEIQPTGHIVREDHSMMVDNATRADVNAAWIRAVNQRGRSDPSRRIDIHLPQSFADSGLPPLFERDGEGFCGEFLGHDVSINHRSLLCNDEAVR